MNCKICGTETTDLLHPKLNHLYHYCPVCNTYMKDDSLLPSSETELKAYLRHNNSIDQVGYVDYLKDFVDKSILPYHTGFDLLEFGSGPTPVLSELLERDYHFHVTSYDFLFAPSKEYRNQMYDVISSTEVLEHVFDPVSVFEEWVSLLNENGIIAVMTLFHPNQPLAFFDWWYIRDITHVIFYSEKSFEYLANRFNLSIVFTDQRRMIVFRKKRKDET